VIFLDRHVFVNVEVCDNEEITCPENTPSFMYPCLKREGEKQKDIFRVAHR
jgi:hypothetical protein